MLYKHDTCLRVNYISIEDMVGPPFELSIYYTRIKLHLLSTLANDTYSIGMDVMIERWKLISSVYLLKSFRMYDVMIERWKLISSVYLLKSFRMYDVMIERWKRISSVYLLKSFGMYDVMIERWKWISSVYLLKSFRMYDSQSCGIICMSENNATLLKVI